MTEDEKKEFEEFLQWKKEKAEKEQKEISEKTSDDSEVMKDETQTEERVKVEEPSATIIEQEKKEPLISPLMIIAAVFIGLVFFLMFILKISSGGTQTQQAEEEYVAADSIEEVIDVEPVSTPTTKTWDFTIKKDEMTDTKNIWATIQSDDYIVQDFPYNGRTYASITIRYMKKYGYDVLVYISKGQINGREYYGTDYVTARFDDGSPKKYRFDEAADGSSDHVFLRNSSDFISRCKKAKDIKIDIPVYQSGRPVFSFHVDEPLVWREE